jgi:phenylpyruvate tautomerase PptA (4-oxalocrotonate tautomerase family)
MPLYRISSEEGVLSPADREELAKRISELHLRLAGGVRGFVNVTFDTYRRGDVYIGGKIASPISLTGIIRTGRTHEVKLAMVKALQDTFVEVTGLSPANLTVGLTEASPKYAMIGGVVVPEVGEEEAWLKTEGAAFASA